MKKEIILFDVDGTIIDSYKGIRKCFIKVLDEFNCPVNEDLLKFCVGPPLAFSFQKYFNIPADKVEDAVSMYREVYHKYGKNNFELYDGIVEVLKGLKERGKIIATATSKYEPLAKEMMASVGIEKYFDYIVGAHEKNEEKLPIIQKVIELTGNRGIENYVLIGDTIFDLEAAQKINMDCIIVEYGFGSEATARKATKSVKRAQDILTIIK